MPPGAEGKLPDGSSLGEFVSIEVLGRADVVIVVDVELGEISCKLLGLFEGNLTGKLHSGVQVVKLVGVLAGKYVLERLLVGNFMAREVGR